MQFNGHSDGQDIVSGIIDSTGQNAVADIEQITRASNEAGRIIRVWIYEAYGGWQDDDSNNTNVPSARAALASGQSQYTLPPDLIAIKQISVKDESGSWSDLTPITLEEIHARSNEDDFNNTPGNPRYYRPIGNAVELYPAPNYSQSASFRVQFSRGSVAFLSTDTTKTPGFSSEFHGAVVVGASYIIGANRTLKNAVLIRDRWHEYEQLIKSFYKARFAELSAETYGASREDPLTFLV